MRSLSDLSPGVVSKIIPSLFQESGLAPDHLATSIVPKLATVWAHPQWISILQNVLNDLQEKLIEHCLNFLKKNNESEALVYWSNDRQFCNSLSPKIIALLRELEVMYPLEGSQPINSRSTAQSFKWEVECCIVLALLVEVDNHLKNFMLLSTSKFIVDTLKAYVVHEIEDRGQGSSSESSGDELESGEEEDLKANELLKGLMDLLGSNAKHTIFEYHYNVRNKTWSLYSSIERKELKVYENRDITSRIIDSNMVPQLEKTRTPRNRTSLAASLVSQRKSFQTMSQGSIHKKHNHVMVLNETFKPEFWSLLLSKYGTTD